MYSVFFICARGDHMIKSKESSAGQLATSHWLILSHPFVTSIQERVTAGTTQQVHTVRSAVMVTMEMRPQAVLRIVNHVHAQGARAVP